MKSEQLKGLLSLGELGESQSFEFKARYSPESAGKQVCAFLNSGGGYLVCGVDVLGRIGTADIERNLMQGISPQAFVSFETQKVEGKSVLVIEVPSGKDVPYSFKNDIYVRRGETTEKADIATIRDMVFRRQAEPERWERRFSDALIGEDLDEVHLRSVVAAIRESGRYPLRGDRNDSLILEDLSGAKYGKLTNAGDVLFCKNTARRYPQVQLKAVRFTGDKTDALIQDLQHFYGPAMQVLEDVYAFIVRNIPVRAHFSTGSLARKDVPLYPLQAIREGLVNALVHRDYAGFSGGISVHIYPRRMEIWNSGEFPAGITAENLKTGHISILRNPDIAHVFYLRGLMEKMGRGSRLIQKLCAEQGLPSPEWRSEAGIGVTLTLYAPEATPEATPEVKKLLQQLKGDMSRREMQSVLGLKDPDHFRDAYINPALQFGWIEMTEPQSPRSPVQRYRLTLLGKNLVSK